MLLPAVYFILHGAAGTGGTSSGGSLVSAFLRVPDLRSTVSRTSISVDGQPGTQERVMVLAAAAAAAMPFPAAALEGWRRTQQRGMQSDASWARKVIDELWCVPIASVPPAVLEPALEELGAAMARRSLLDRDLAVLGCRHACDDARLRGGVETDERGQPVCGDGLCVCDGGLSYGLDQTRARDEPAIAFYAAQVVWSPAIDRHSGALRGGQRAAASNAANATADAASGGAHQGPPREPTLRDLRRHDSVHARARQELAATAIPRSVAFAAGGSERGAARHRCAHLTFGQAFHVSLRAPDVAPRFAEIIISAKPALLECRRTAASAAAAAIPSTAAADGLSVGGAAAEQVESVGGGLDSSVSGGDTFVLRAYSSDVVVQPPILREQPSRDLYAGQFFVADAGNYEVDIYWTNTGYASWFDVNEISTLIDPAPVASAPQPPVALANHAALVTEAVNGSSAAFPAAHAALCPTNNNVFAQRLLDEHLPHWSANFSVGEVNESTRPLASMPPPRACTSAAVSGRWIGSDWAPLTCYNLRYSADMLMRCAQRRPLLIELYGDSIMRGLYFDLAELLTETPLDRAWAKRHAGPCAVRSRSAPCPHAERRTSDGRAVVSLLVRRGKGKRLSVTRAEVTISWAWWTLNATTHDPRDRYRPTPPGLSNWSLADRNAVILFGSAAHNMRYGTVRAYAASLRGLATELKSTPVRAKLFWLVGAANHVHDENIECTPDATSPIHRMAFHRSMLFSAAGAEALRGISPQLDMWRPTAGQAALCAKVHYDELYVKAGKGLVSRSVANLLLNGACNVRLLPAAALTNGVA